MEKEKDTDSNFCRYRSTPVGNYWQTGDSVQVQVDCDNKEITFFKNGTFLQKYENNEFLFIFSYSLSLVSSTRVSFNPSFSSPLSFYNRPLPLLPLIFLRISVVSAPEQKWYPVVGFGRVGCDLGSQSFKFCSYRNLELLGRISPEKN